MKKSLLFLSASLLLTTSVYAQLQKSPVPTTVKQEIFKTPMAQDGMYIGYTDSDLSGANGIGGVTGKLGASIYYPASAMQEYSGNTISRIRFAVDEGISNVAVFIKSSLTGEAIASSAASSIVAGWNTFELTTPYTINGEAIYIGYEGTVATSCYPIIFNPKKNAENAAWLGVGGEWENYFSQGWGTLAILAYMEGENLPQNNVSVSLDPVSGGLIKVNTPFSLTGAVTNLAANKITSFDIEYSINGGAAISKTFSCDMANCEAYSFSIDGITITSEDDYTIAVTVKNLNGSTADTDPSDNNASVSFSGYERNVDRNVLMEHFTTEKCPNCPAFTTELKRFLDEKGHPDNLIWQTHHAGYYTDNFTTTEDKAYVWFYGTTSTWAPGIMFDRTHFNENDEGPVMFTYELEKYTNMALEVPAFVSVGIEGTYDHSIRELKVKVLAEKVREMLPGQSDVRLNIFLQESGLKANSQSGGGSNYIHDAVMRASLTGTWGEKVTLPVGEYESETYTYTVSDKWDVTNMRIVAFISNYNPNDPSGSQVYNAKIMDLPIDPSSISKVEFATSPIYENNGKLYINSEYTNGQILNITGSVVKEFNNNNVIDLNDLNNGIYVVVVRKDNKVSSTKIVLNR